MKTFKALRPVGWKEITKSHVYLNDRVSRSHFDDWWLMFDDTHRCINTYDCPVWNDNATNFNDVREYYLYA